jgi:hypothetical protein
MSERLSESGKLRRVGESLASLFRLKRNDSPQYTEDDWRSKLEPAGEDPAPWVDDAVGLWPLQELRAGLTNYTGPGNLGDLSHMSELELAEE